MKYAELCGGIGGFGLGFPDDECVLFAEWDKFAQRTWMANNRHDGVAVISDLTKYGYEDIKDLPDFDALMAGFPCQPFSSAGKRGGTSDKRWIFDDIMRFVAVKCPRVVLLENVIGIKKTLPEIAARFEGLGYSFDYREINARTFVPQNRRRIFMVAWRGGNDAWHFNNVFVPATDRRLAEILEDAPEKYRLSDEHWTALCRNSAKQYAKGFNFTRRVPGPDGVSVTLTVGHDHSLVDDKYGISEHLWRYMQQHWKDKPKCKPPVRHVDEASHTITTNPRDAMLQRPGRTPRKFTPRECARLMGFPDSFTIPVSDTQAYRQFGNAVVVPVVREIAREIKRVW